MNAQDKDRFWSKVDMAGPVPRHCPELGPCWVWTGGCLPFGYGHFSYKRMTLKAHRAAWEIHFGLILDGMCVLHKCDNPACCRLAHLFLGTVANNQRDMAAKGRSAIGARNGKARLDEFSARLIRRLHHNRGLSQGLLARVFGVKGPAVWKICNRRTWKHIT